MHERVRQEIELLKLDYPDLSHGEALDWVLLPSFALPVGRYGKVTTAVLFRIPSAYPQAAPDDFFVDVDLRLKDGNAAPAFNPNAESSSGPAPIPGEWGWFSWHPQVWRPAAAIADGDNLMVFVRGVGLCLRGEESA